MHLQEAAITTVHLYSFLSFENGFKIAHAYD